jgi:diacylglycerol kinase (ATP)
LFTTLWRYRCRPLVYTLDGRMQKARVNTLVVGNGQYFGGGMLVAPQAQIDDRQLEVIVVGDLHPLEFLWHTPKLYRGTHLSLRQVTTLSGRELAVTSPHPLSLQADGEFLGVAPVTFRLLPSRIKIRSVG